MSQLGQVLFPLVTVAGITLMVASVILFGVGFGWSADSRARARVNVATILSAYVGLVLALTAKILESSAP